MSKNKHILAQIYHKNNRRIKKMKKYLKKNRILSSSGGKIVHKNPTISRTTTLARKTEGKGQSKGCAWKTKV